MFHLIDSVERSFAARNLLTTVSWEEFSEKNSFSNKMVNEVFLHRTPRLDFGSNSNNSEDNSRRRERDGLTSANLDLTFRGGNIAQWLAYLLPDPAALGSISRQKKLSTLLRLINDAG